jgi:uncharacterized protein YjiS (DUF1127 family)
MTTLTASPDRWRPAAFIGRIAFVAFVALRRLRRLRTRRPANRLQHLPDHLLADLGLVRTDLLTATIWGRSRL